VPCPKRKKLEASHGKHGGLVSRSVPSWLPDGAAELLDDVVGEVLEYVQCCNHLVIVEGSAAPWLERRTRLNMSTVVLRILALRGAASSHGSSSLSLSSSWMVDSSESMPLSRQAC
jgi:hypothetical protein